MSDRERRVGENEAIFRAVNEEVRSRIPTFSTHTQTMTIVCECGMQSCIEQFQIRRDEYERIRADSALFVIRPGHEIEDTEHVVSRTDGYWVVRKDPGLPERLARATDTSAA